MRHLIKENRFENELNIIKNKQKLPNATVLYGSSTFAIWKSAEKDLAKYNVINCGFGGSVAEEGYMYYDIPKSFNPKILFWYFGDNDPVIGYNVEDIEEYYEATWKKFKEDFPNIRIITILTKVCESRDEFAPAIEKVNNWQREYCKTHDYIDYIDLKDICKNEKGEYLNENFLEDKLHFNSKAYEQIIKKMVDKLEKIK